MKGTAVEIKTLGEKRNPFILENIKSDWYIGQAKAKSRARKSLVPGLAGMVLMRKCGTIELCGNSGERLSWKREV